MALRQTYLVIVVLLLAAVTAAIAYADVNSGVACTQDTDCNDLAEDLSQQYYCHLSFRTCFLKTVAVPAAAPAIVPTAAPTPEAQSQALADDVAGLQSDAASVQQEINSIRADLGTVQNRLSQVERDTAALKGNTGSVSQQTNSLATGLAGLQVELNATQSDVAALEQNVEKQQRFSSVVKALFFVLLVIAVALAVLYYLSREKTVSVDPKVINYITKHIREGKKFPFLKESLLKAGWGEPEILQAYKETTKRNYQQYLQQRLSGKPVLLPSAAAAQRPGKPPAALPRGRSSADKNKVISIAVVTILLLIGIFFLLSGTVGKAVFYEQQVSEQTREVTQKIDCTPPQILTPDKDTCCDDLNANTICDHSEREVASLAEEGRCIDNLQCGTDRYCIDGQCTALQELYVRSVDSPNCGLVCDYYALTVEASDSETNRETYNLKPKRGSYTCVGALEWKVMENVDHCQGEKPIVPILIIYKEPGSIIREEVITLHQEESKSAQHPTLQNCLVTLTVSKIYEPRGCEFPSAS